MKKGWEIKKLGEVCEFNNGDRGTNYPSKSARTIEGIPFVNAGHLTDNGLDFVSMDYISRERYNLLGNGKIKKNDILFCLRGSLGKFASVGDLSEGAIASSLVIVRPTSKVIAKFIMAYFSSKMCANMINFYGNGAAQPNLSAASLKNFLIPIPPLPEQQRIVSILDEAFSSIEQAKENLQRNLQNAKELFQSELNSIFTNKGEGWEGKTLGEVTNVQRGSSPRPKGDPKYFSETKTEYNWITISDISAYAKNNVLLQTREWLTEAGSKQSRYVDKNEFIIAVSGSTTGKCCITGINGFIYDGLAVVKIINNTIEPKFLLNYMMSLYTTINNSKTGAAFPNINTNYLNNLSIPFPPLKTQQKIVQQIDKLSAETKRLEAMYQQKLDALEELKKSILQKAFSGELS